MSSSSPSSPFSNYGYALTTVNAQRTPHKIAMAYRGVDYSFSELNDLSGYVDTRRFFNSL